MAAVGFVGVVDAEEGDCGAQDFHRRRVFGDAAEKVDDLGVELACGGKICGEAGEFGFGGKLAEPEEVGCLLKSGALRELVDVNAAIGKDADVTVNPADG